MDYSYSKASGEVKKSFIILVDKVEQSMTREEIVNIAQQEIFKEHGIPKAIIGYFTEL